MNKNQTKNYNTFRLISVILLICFLSAVMPISVWSDDIITGIDKNGKISYIEYKFNLDTNTVDGALQIIKTGGTDSVVPIPSATNPSLLIEPTKKGGEFCYDVGIQSRDLVIETSIRIDGTPTSDKRIFTVSDQTVGVYVVFGTIDSSRRLKLCDGTIAGTLAAGVFHDITYVINNVTHKFDVILNGKTVASGKTIPNAAFDSVRKFRFQIANIQPAGEKIYINKLRAYASNKVLTDDELEKTANIKKVVAQPEDKRKKWASEADVSTAMRGNILLYTGSSKARVGDEIKVIDGNNTNAKPFCVNQTAMVPLLFLAENLGAESEYTGDNRIEINYKGHIISFKTDSKEYTVDRVTKTLPEPILEKEGTIYVPLCTFSDAFGTKVFWDKVGYIGIGDTVDEFDMRDSDFQNVLWEAIRPAVFEIPSTDKIIEDFKNNSSNVHPRVILTSERLSEMKALIKTDPVMKKWYELLIQQAELHLKKANCVYGRTDGTRMLDTCREAEERIRVTALAYLLSGQSKYKTRAVSEMINVCSFPDWNPYHFLDPSEMVVGVALGYDWLYNELTSSQRKTIETAIKNFALEEVLTDYAGATGNQRTWRWCQRYQADGTLNSNYPQNWVAVCGGGMTVAALAVADVYPDLMAKVITKAMPTISDLLYVYSPDGANYDGSTYWELSCRYLAYMSSALTTACGTDYGMMDLPCVEGLMYFDDSLTMPTGLINFDYATENSHPNAGHLLWFAKRLGKPELTNFYMNSSRIDVMSDLSMTAMLWYNPADIDLSYTKKRAEIYTRGVEIVNLTTQGYGANDMSVGFMGRPAGFGQQHAGSFILDALGVRWSRDPGTTVESYFTNPQMDRTAYYNQRPEGHSTIVINPQYGNNQNLYETAYMEKSEWGTSKRFAICNMTKSYEFLGAKSVRRGIMLDNARHYAHIRDEVKSDEPMDFYWFMQLSDKVEAQISTDGKVALLSSQGKRFAVEILTEGDYKFYVTGAEPLEESPHPTDRVSPGNAKRLNLHIEDMTEINLDIGMMPLAGNQTKSDYKPQILPLNSWTTDSENVDLPVVKGIYADGKLIKDFAPNSFVYNIPLGTSTKMPTLTAVCEADCKTEIIQPALIGNTAAVGKITVIDKINPDLRQIYYVIYDKSTAVTDDEKISGPKTAMPFVENFDDFEICSDGTMIFDKIVSRSDLDSAVGKVHTLGDLMFDNYLGSFAKPEWNETYGGTAVFDTTPAESWSMSVNVAESEEYYVSASVKKSGNVVRTCVQHENSNGKTGGVVFEADRNIFVGSVDTGLDWKDNVWYNIDYFVSSTDQKIIAYITDTSTGVTHEFETADYFTPTYGGTKISICANAFNQYGGVVEVGHFKVDKAYKIAMESPFNGEENVQLDSNVVINADDLDVDNLTVEITGVAGGQTAIKSQASGNKIIFNPESDFAPDTTYTVKLKNAGSVVYTGSFKTMSENNINKSIVSVTDNGKTAYTVRKTFRLSKADAAACFIVASYDCYGKITDCTIKRHIGAGSYGDLTAEVKDGLSIKAFMWENLDSLKPLVTFENIKNSVSN